MSDGPVVVFATFQPAPGKERALLETLRPMIERTREEPGNEVYDLYSSGDDRRSFHLLERYTDRDALEAHRAADYYQAYRERLPDLLETGVDVLVLAGVDVAPS